MYMTHEQMVKSLAAFRQRRELEELNRTAIQERIEATYQLADLRMECYLGARQREQLRRARQNQS